MYIFDLYSQFEMWLQRRIGGTAEDAALDQSPEIDGGSIQWTVASLDEDLESRQFFAGISSFFKSMVIEDPQNTFRKGWRPSVACLD